MGTETTGAIRPNEITVTKYGTYYNGGHDYSVTFVLDYATITVSIEHDQDIETEDDGDGIVVGSDSDDVELAIVAAAAIQLYNYYGIDVAVA